MNKISSKIKRSFGFGAFNGDHNHDHNFYNDAFTSNDGYYLTNPHHYTHSHTLVTKKFGFPVPQPYPVPYPVKVNINFYLKKKKKQPSLIHIFRFHLNGLFPYRFQFRFITIIQLVFLI